MKPLAFLLPCAAPQIQKANTLTRLFAAPSRHGLTEKFAIFAEGAEK
jgi:hypothetical protein